jgi:hypothetical protein
MFIYILFLLSQTQFLGIVDADKLLHLPGVIKFNDIIFLVLVIWAIYKNHGLKQDTYFNFNKIILFVILYFFLFVSFSTAFIVNTTPFIDALKVGRFILINFGFYYITISIIRDVNDLKKVWKFFKYYVIILFVIQILSDILGRPFLLDESIILCTPYPLGNLNVFRIYWNVFPITLVFFFGMYNIISKNCVVFKVSKFEFLISLFLIIHTFGRNFWAAVLVGIFLYYIILNVKKFNLISKADSKIGVRFFTVIIILFAFGYIISLFQGANGLFSSLVLDAIDDISGKSTTGTMLLRIMMMGNMFEVYSSKFIYQILGLGLVHPDSHFSVIHGGGKDLLSWEGFFPLNQDYGWPSMLFSFGIIGVILLALVYIISLKKMYSFASQIDSNEFRAFILMGLVIIAVTITIRAWAAQTLLYFDLPLFLALLNVFKRIEINTSKIAETESGVLISPELNSFNKLELEN